MSEGERTLIKVKLMKYTDQPERTVAMAARLCYSPCGAEELAEKMSDEQVETIAQMALGGNLGYNLGPFLLA